MNAGCAKGRDSTSRNRVVHLSICRSSTFLPLSCFHSLSRSLFHCRRRRSAVVDASLLSRSSARRCSGKYLSRFLSFCHLCFSFEWLGVYCLLWDFDSLLILVDLISRSSVSSFQGCVFWFQNPQPRTAISFWAFLIHSKVNGFAHHCWRSKLFGCSACDEHYLV